MAGAGNSFEVNNYDFLDKKPLPGVNYYRLRQMDLDGQEEFSRVVSVDLMNPEDLSILRVYPNPASGGKLTLFLPENINGEMVVRLVNPAGQVLRHASLATRHNLQINSENGNVFKKILVQH